MNSMYKSCLSSISDYAKKENRLLMYIGDFNKQLDYLYKLIKIINVQNLTQVKQILLYYQNNYLKTNNNNLAHGEKII